VCDVQSHILRVYAISHSPLTRLASVQWRKILLSFLEQRYRRRVGVRLGRVEIRLRTVFLLRDLARHGQVELIEWIRRRRFERNRPLRLGTLHTIILDAARGGHERIIRNVYENPLDERYLADGDTTGLVLYTARELDSLRIAAHCQGREVVFRTESPSSEEEVLSVWHRSSREWCKKNEEQSGSKKLYFCRFVEPSQKDFSLFDWRRWGMAAAARGGHVALVRLFHTEWGCISVVAANDTVAAAARGGHVDIVNLCRVEFGATCDVNTIMRNAARGGHEQLVRMCIHWWTATDVQGALFAAARGGHVQIVRFFLFEYTWTIIVKDARKARRIAKRRGFPEVIAVCDKYLEHQYKEALLFDSRDKSAQGIER